MEVTGAALVLLAAGRGERAGGTTAKQFAVDRHGRSLLARGAAVAAGIEWSQVVVVAPPDHQVTARSAIAAAGPTGAQIIAGGAGRLDSLKRGVEVIDPAMTSIVVVHDGTRPFTPRALLHGVAEIVRAGEADAAWPAARPANTVVSMADAVPRAFVPAELLVVATPIAVRLEVLQQVLAGAVGSEGALVPLILSSGARWETVPDSPLNFKVTTPQDLTDALELMESQPWPERGSA